MLRTKVLVFLVANFANQHGGVLWATNLLESLSGITDMDFVVVTANSPKAFLSNEHRVRNYGFDHVFVPFRDASDAEGDARFRALQAAILDKYYFLYERESRRQQHVDAAVVDVVLNANPDLIVVNDIWSAMCFPSAFRLGVPVCLITLNDEAAFHRAHRSYGGPMGHGLHQRMERWIHRRGNWIANWRIKRHVRRVFEQCAGVAALTRTDLPKELTSGRTALAVLPPLLKESTERWSYQGNRCVFFVGDIAYFPNRLAIEWICQSFAPQLYAIDDSIRICIVGASSHQMLAGAISNVRFFGRASRDLVVRHMTSDDMFIAPIANGFGAKLKLAECASFGMPFFATQSAMSGLQFLTTPQFNLGRPAEAARLVVDYMNSPDALWHLSRSILEEMRQARANQSAAWRGFLRRAIETRCSRRMY